MAVNSGPDSIVDDGLVFYVDPANTDSWDGPDASLVNNLVSTNTGSIVNDTSGSYGDNNSFAFDGTDDYIDCGTGLGNSLGTVTSLSVSLWVKAPSTSINDFVFYIGDLSNNYGALTINIVVNKIRIRLNDNAGNFYLNFTSNDWNNIVFVYDGSNQNNSLVYINGQLQTIGFSSLFPSSLNLSGLKTIIGTGYSTAYSFDGSLSNVFLYNKALSSQEVKQNFNALKGRFI